MQNDTTPHLPVNHVFVDLENVKTIDGSVVGGKNLTFHLFLGPQNKKLDVDIVETLLDNAQTVKLIRSPMAGKNALDFVLAYHLGQAVQTDPKGYFHIISKDGGFDSLVKLLETKRVKVKRHADWSGLNFDSPPKKPVSEVPAPAAKSLSPGAEKVLENLRKSEKNRPKRKKTLVSHALNSLGKGATTDMIASLAIRIALARSILLNVFYQGRRFRAASSWPPNSSSTPRIFVALMQWLNRSRIQCPGGQSYQNNG